MKFLIVSLFYSFLLLLVGFSNSRAQPDITLGEGISTVAPDSSISFQFKFRMQNLFEADYQASNQNWEQRFLIRRARLKFDGFIFDPSLKFDFEMGLSNNDIGVPDMPQNDFASNLILDAALKWTFRPGWSLWAGQNKLPGNRERVVSSQNLQLVDRSILNSLYTLDRDMGIQLHHGRMLGPGYMKAAAAISTGEGRNITQFDDGGMNYTLRMEYLPFGKFENGGDYVEGDFARESTPKLAVGGTYAFNHQTNRSRGQIGEFLDGYRNLTSYFLDGMFKYQGFSALMEWAQRSVSGNPVVESFPQNSFYEGYALNIQGGYLFRNNWELAGRFAFTDPNAVTEFEDEYHYTLGASKYIDQHNLKVQTDITWKEIRFSENHLLYRLQFEVGI